MSAMLQRGDGLAVSAIYIGGITRDVINYLQHRTDSKNRAHPRELTRNATLGLTGEKVILHFSIGSRDARSARRRPTRNREAPTTRVCIHRDAECRAGLIPVSAHEKLAEPCASFFKFLQFAPSGPFFHEFSRHCRKFRVRAHSPGISRINFAAGKH